MDDVYQSADAKADASINPMVKYLGNDVGQNDYDNCQNDLVFIIQLHKYTPAFQFNCIILKVGAQEKGTAVYLLCL